MINEQILEHIEAIATFKIPSKFKKEISACEDLAELDELAYDYIQNNETDESKIIGSWILLILAILGKGN